MFGKPLNNAFIQSLVPPLGLNQHRYFLKSARRPVSPTYLIRAGGLVGAVVITVVLVSFSGLRLSVDVRLIDGRDVVAQGDGLHRLVDATADALADFGA